MDQCSTVVASVAGASLHALYPLSSVVEDHAPGWTFLIACTNIGAVWAMVYSMWTS